MYIGGYDLVHVAITLETALLTVVVSNECMCVYVCLLFGVSPSFII